MNMFDRVIDGDRLRKLQETNRPTERTFRVNLEVKTSDPEIKDNQDINDYIKDAIAEKGDKFYVPNTSPSDITVSSVDSSEIGTG